MYFLSRIIIISIQIITYKARNQGLVVLLPPHFKHVFHLTLIILFYLHVLANFTPFLHAGRPSLIPTSMSSHETLGLVLGNLIIRQYFKLSNQTLILLHKYMTLCF